MKLNGKRGFRSWPTAVAAAVCLLAAAMPSLGADTRAWIGMGPPLKYGTWSMVTGKVVNGSPSELQGLLVVMADSAADVQFSTPVWVPPESRVQVPLPFLTESNEITGMSTNVTVRLVQTTGGIDSNLAPDDHSPQLNQTEDAPTGVCVSRDDDEVGAAVTRLRASQRRKPKSASIEARNMPTTALGLMSFADFVYGAREPLSVPQASAVREWVERGGHLWIVADRANQETVRLIMGNEWSCEEVGRTELPSVSFVSGKTVDAAKEYPEPVQMVRMLAPGMEVTQTVDGWPAVMWRGLGKGQVVLTTLEPRSLGITTTAEPFPYWFELMSTRFLGPLGKAGESGIAPREAQTHDAMHSLALSIVGHQVVQRAPVLVILGVLGGALLVIGWRFGVKRRLELLAPAAIVLSVLATGSMLMLGAMGRGSTPLTVAGMADGQVLTASPRVVYDGVADIYSPSAFEGSIVAPLGGWVKPVLSTQSGHVIRMRWADLEPMRWDHIHFPSATLRTTVSGTAHGDGPISARGTFDMNGFRGQLKGASGQWESVIVGPGGRLAPAFSSNGNFVAGQDQELRPGETTRGSIAPDAAHRIEAMQPWVANKSFNSDVTLYTWAKGLDSGVTIERDGAGAVKSERQLMTLLSVPLEIERPTGAFNIPPAFIKLNTARVAKIGGMTPVYDERNHVFMGKIPTGATSTIRFTVPQDLLPLKVQKYNLRIDMSAPDREVKLFAIRRGQEGRTAIYPIPGGTFSHPAGPIAVDLPADADLQLEADGSVILGLDVSGPADPNNNTSTWTLNDMLLTVTAQAQGVESK